GCPAWLNACNSSRKAPENFFSLEGTMNAGSVDGDGWAVKGGDAARCHGTRRGDPCDRADRMPATRESDGPFRANFTAEAFRFSCGRVRCRARVCARCLVAGAPANRRPIWPPAKSNALIAALAAFEALREE